MAIQGPFQVCRQLSLLVVVIRAGPQAVSKIHVNPHPLLTSIPHNELENSLFHPPYMLRMSPATSKASAKQQASHQQSSKLPMSTSWCQTRVILVVRQKDGILAGIKIAISRAMKGC
jgi:hypothetical protein